MIGIVIATFGDKEAWGALADRAMASVARQTTQPGGVIRLHDVHGTLARTRNDAARELPPECDFIVFLDGDDELAPDYIERMDSVPGDVRYPSVQYIRDGVPECPPTMLPSGNILARNYIVIGAAINRNLFERVRGFQEWPIWEDWALWLECKMAGATFTACPDAVYVVHRRDGSRDEQRNIHARTGAKMLAAYRNQFTKRRIKQR